MVASGEKYKKPNCKILKLSIIIPVYDAEKFLYKCLESVCKQDLVISDYEIIVINDGSTDHSEQIIADFQKIAENMVYTKQENKGVSAARNAGLAIAKGEFVTFVDADDYINPLSLKKILNYINSYDLDVFYGHMEIFDEYGGHLQKGQKVGECKCVKKGFFHQRRTYPGIFYKKDILRNLNFHTQINFGEDTLFNAKVQSFAQRVSSCDIPYYNYIFRANSLSKQGSSEKSFHGLLIAINDLRSFQNENFYRNVDAKIYFDQIYKIFVARIFELGILPTFNRRKYLKLIKLLKSENLIYLLQDFKTKYPFIAHSFFAFATYQKYLLFKTKIHKLIYRG